MFGQLKSCLDKKGKEKGVNKVLVLLDWENLQQNLGLSPGEPSLMKRINDCLQEIAKQVGGIVGIYAFMPPHASYIWGQQLHEARFVIISCPKIKNKAGVEVDTTDATLIRVGTDMINSMCDLTHLCVGTGDIDFSDLLIAARHKGLETMLIVAATRPLNKKIIPLTGRKPGGGKGRMIYVLSSYN